jgi:hypothetical protein
MIAYQLPSGRQKNKRVIVLQEEVDPQCISLVGDAGKVINFRDNATFGLLVEKAL